ncbi:hypothetical protein JCM3770_000499 [Rhodotorula araucariae]
MLQVHLLRISQAFSSTVGDIALRDESLDPLLDLVDEVSRGEPGCLCGRLLGRYTVATLLNRPWSSLTFAKSSADGPTWCIQGHSASPVLDFNASHDSDLVVVASLLSPPPALSRIGVDVMRIRNPWEDTVPLPISSTASPNTCTPASSVAEACPLTLPRRTMQLTAHELAALATLPASEQKLCHALALWTLKEAYVKAIGEGLHFDLQKVEFRLTLCTAGDKDGSASAGVGRRDGARMDGWRFSLVEVQGSTGEEAYFLALAEQARDAHDEVQLLPRGASPDWVHEVDLVAIETLARNAE